jgi:glycosyltransferase involved in cell wall biosynthesis
MNVGGPAYHVSLLSGRLDPARYETLLVSGKVGQGEASFTGLAESYGARLEIVESLGPDIRPLADGRALMALFRIARRFRPDIVHTHTAKAGLLGRLAALGANRPRPIIVHTYHGHVLEGYFGPLQTGVYRLLERAIAHATDCLIGVSQATVDDLVRLRVGPRPKFQVIPLGLELERFLRVTYKSGRRFREEVGAEPGEMLLTYVGRLVAIKRLDLMLRAVARARRAGTPVCLAVVGDGVLRPDLERLVQDLGLDGHVRFLGYRSDLDAITAGADAAILTSDNEGTPVSLIEAAASSLPAVATAVGGVPEVVTEGSGLLVPPNDEVAIADAITRLGTDEKLRRAMGRRARRHVIDRFSARRLIDDVDALYRSLLHSR